MDDLETIRELHTQDVRLELREPPLWRVMLLNDDFTPMDFVVEVLARIFQKPLPEAERIMMQVHLEGRGLCGVYPHGIAESKVAHVVAASRKAGYPLRAEMQRDGSQ